MTSASRPYPGSGAGLGFGWWLLAIVVPFFAMVLFVFSYKRESNFRSEATPDFIAVSVPAPINGQQWAREYWTCARSFRTKYTYGVPLPATPPPEFRIPEEQTVPRETAEQVRLLYWRELQKAWLSPGAWQITHPIKFDWLIG